MSNQVFKINVQRIEIFMFVLSSDNLWFGEYESMISIETQLKDSHSSFANITKM